jgi:hypothetical protein
MIGHDLTIPALAARASGRRAFPLDGVTALAFAYSLRRLRAAHNGALVRLRRGSDNAEQDFASGLDGWLDWDAVLAWAGGATAYGVRWYDQSGFGRDLSEASASLQPVASAGPGNLTFDGANDFLATGAFAMSQPWTFYIAYRRVSGVQPSYENVFDGLSADRGTLYRRVASFTHGMWAGNEFVGGSSIPIGSWAVVGGVFNGASSVINLNNAATFTGGNVGSNSMDGLTLGSQGGGSTSRASNVLVSDLFGLSRASTTGELTSVIAAMKAPWEIG